MKCTLSTLSFPSSAGAGQSPVADGLIEQERASFAFACSLSKLSYMEGKPFNIKFKHVSQCTIITIFHRSIMCMHAKNKRCHQTYYTLPTSPGHFCPSLPGGSCMSSLNTLEWTEEAVSSLSELSREYTSRAPSQLTVLGVPALPDMRELPFRRDLRRSRFI